MSALPLWHHTHKYRQQCQLPPSDHLVLSLSGFGTQQSQRIVKQFLVTFLEHLMAQLFYLPHKAVHRVNNSLQLFNFNSNQSSMSEKIPL